MIDRNSKPDFVVGDYFLDDDKHPCLVTDADSKLVKSISLADGSERSYSVNLVQFRTRRLDLLEAIDIRQNWPTQEALDYAATSNNGRLRDRTGHLVDVDSLTPGCWTKNVQTSEIIEK